MNITVPLHVRLLLTRTLLAAWVLFISAFNSLRASSTHPGNPADTIHTVSIKKLQATKKYQVRLFADARNQALFFYASGNSKKIFQLYVFDMEGRLVNQANIRNRETTVIRDFSKGNFFFEVFSNDERIENGKLEIN